MLDNRKHKLIVVVAVCALSLGIATLGYPASSQSIKKYNELYKDIADSKNDKKLTLLWDLMDQIVLDYLNSGGNSNSLQQIYSQLSGYEGPKKSKKTLIGNVIFYTEPDEEIPTYSSSVFDVNGSHYILGLYRFDPFLPGRLSLYSKRGRSWSKIHTFDGNFPIELYSFPEAFSRGYFITLESFIAADRQEGDAKIWLILGGKMIQQARDYNGLVDYAVKVDKSSLTIMFSRFPHNLCEPTMGDRLLYQITFRLNKKKAIEATEYSLTPWLEVLNKYFGFIEKDHLQEAIKCLEDKSILKKLTKKYCPEIIDHKGDVKKGVAYVNISPIEAEEKKWHVEFTTKNDKWLISKVTEIKSDED